MITLFASLALLAPCQSYAIDAARNELTSGVGELTAPGALPGKMMTHGIEAFTVITGGPANRREALFVASFVSTGIGRVLAGGHGAFFSEASLTNPSNRKFLLNGLGWLGGAKRKNAVIGVADLSGVAVVATAEGFKSVSIRSIDANTDLKGVDILCMTDGWLNNNLAGQDRVVRFLRSGGGLLIAGPAWGWQQLNPGKSLLKDHPGNRMLLQFGIGFSPETLEGPYAPSGAENPLLNSERALSALLAGSLNETQRIEASRSIAEYLRLSAQPDKTLLEKLAEGSRSEGGDAGPTRAHPITAAMPFSRLLAGVQLRMEEASRPSQIRAYPSAGDFPGSTDGLRSTTRIVEVDTDVPGWHGLGLYARAGQPVKLSLPSAVVNQNFEIRVGPHTDTLWHLDRWLRFPEVSRSWKVTSPEMVVASPFGGTLFLVAPERSKTGPVRLKVANAVPAIRYALGQTRGEEWKRMVAAPSAPWAEMEGGRVILSVPRSSAMKVQDPERLMRQWDAIMNAVYDLYGAPLRNRPERYAVDRQISAGYMHSGYPIMTGDDVADAFCSLDKLTAGTTQGAVWGFYHEMGHNFQQPDWTFDGTGEVTNNLFSLYGAEMFNGIRPTDYGPAISAMAPAEERKRLLAYLRAGAKFEEWKREPFLALTMYAQLRRAFGWDAYKAVFREYRTLSAAQRPKTDAEKRDQWMVRFSKQVGKNLGPFFSAWGVPTSDAARSSIAHLPAWMPDDWPK